MEEKKLTVKDSSLAFFVGFLLCQLSVVVATCIGLIIAKIFKFSTNQFELFLNTGLGYFILTLFLDLTMIAIFLFFNKNKTNKIFKKITTKKVLFYILVAVASFATLYPIIICIDSLLIRLNITSNTIPYALTTKNYFISILSLVILPAICEELLFRGIIFKGLKQHGKIFSVCITAIMFSIFHMSTTQTVYPLLMGLLLSVIMFYEDNIYYCIIVHTVNNFISLTVSYFNLKLFFNHWSYIILAIVLAGLFIATLTYFIIKNHKNNEKQPLLKNDKYYIIFSIAIMLLIWLVVAFV